MKKIQYTKHGFNIYFLYKFLHKFPYLVALLMEAENLGRIQDLVMGGSDKCMPTLSNCPQVLFSTRKSMRGDTVFERGLIQRLVQTIIYIIIWLTDFARCNWSISGP